MCRMYCQAGTCSWLQVEAEVLDESVANRSALPPCMDGTLPRERERCSLTVRRVLRTRNLLGLRA